MKRKCRRKLLEPVCVVGDDCTQCNPSSEPLPVPDGVLAGDRMSYRELRGDVPVFGGYLAADAVLDSDELPEWERELLRLADPPGIINPDLPFQFEDAVAKVYADAMTLLLRKHSDYGPKNISQSPGGPLNGLRVRLYDKIARINHLLDSGADPENESLRDSFIDALNYAAIALLVLDGKWPE